MPRVKSAAATAEKKSTRTRKSTPPANGHSLTVNEELIRARAYELYESRGRTDGSHEADWFAAEAELRSRIA